VTFRSTRSRLPEIDITPLIDILFILIIFFVLTTTFGQSQIRVQLPNGQASTVDAALAVYITINSEGTLFWEEGAVSEEDLITLARQAQEAGKTLLIAADRSISYGHVASFLSRLNQNGIQSVGLALQED
jgi:biopolymer transport protein ExbD